MRNLPITLCAVALAAAAMAFSTLAAAHDGNKHKSAASDQQSVQAVDVTLLDLELRDRKNRPVRLKSDLIGDNIVVVDFIYTSCLTVCPVLSEVMAQVKDGLGNDFGGEVQMVSMTVDPANDIPKRLQDYASRFGDAPGWRWLTGYKPDVEKVLDGLGAYAPDFRDHPTMMLVGDRRTGKWYRFNGFPDPDQVLDQVAELQAARARAEGRTPSKSNSEKSARRLHNRLKKVVGTPKKIGPVNDTSSPEKEAKARAYFTDTRVVDQNGDSYRFYSDLLKGKVVVVSLFFTGCDSSCPLANQALADLQDSLGDRFGRDIVFLSISVDPEMDTPAILKDYAGKYGAEPGWHFLTGRAEDIRRITRRLGMKGDDIRAHLTYLMIGNVDQAKWRKLLPSVPSNLLADQLMQLAG